MTKSVSEILADLDRSLREKYDPLGCVDGANGAYHTGHIPHVAPAAYLCERYAGLDNDGIALAEEECGQAIHASYQDLLRHMNGARLLGVSLHGTIGATFDRSGVGIGQPISLRYQNIIERPDYIPDSHLGIGAINGAWSSQGHLYLTAAGGVELYNARFDLIGARWSSLSEFLRNEMPRRFSLYDDEGRLLEGAKRLPGDTSDWEQLTREDDMAAKRNNGLLRRVVKKLRGT